MTDKIVRLHDIGEKSLLGEVIKPALEERWGQPSGEWDDCYTHHLDDAQALVVSTDAVPTDLLSRQYGQMSYRDLGGYLVTVNVSDVVSSGAVPSLVLLNLTFERSLPVEDVREMIGGAADMASAYSVRIVGGDTKSGPSEQFSAVCIGFGQQDSLTPRSAGLPEDSVYLSGPVGAFGAALRYFREPSLADLRAEDVSLLRTALVRPVARLDLLGVLQAHSVHAAIDVSDGLGQSLFELASASRLDFDIKSGDIPSSEATVRCAEALGVPLEDILFGIGLDLQIVALATTSPGPNWSQIGTASRAKANRSSVMLDGEILRVTGFEHFSHPAADYLEDTPWP